MAQKLINPPTPDQRELTAPDDEMLGIVASPYVKLMLPKDTVLQYKGGDYRIYAETLRDDSCTSALQQRRLAVTKCETTVEPGADDPASIEAADWMRAQLAEIEWDRITNGMLYACWYGHAVAEVIYGRDMATRKVTLVDIRVRDRSRFAYATDGGPPWIWNARLAKWSPLPPRKMWTINTGADNDDEPYGIGLAHYCYWPVFFKRNNIKFWLIFLEKFGMPTVIAKMPGTQYDDVAQRNKVKSALRALASETGIVLPEGTTFDFASAQKSGTQDYDNMRAAMDRAITKVIIGQTASTEGTPGRLGNEELQGEVRRDLVKADADLVCGAFNNTVVRWLTEWNFPGATPPKVWRAVDPPENLDTLADRDAKLYKMGWERTDDSFATTYGDGWQRKAQQQTGLPADALAAQAAADFAELGALASLKAGKRADQQAIHDAAIAFADHYRDTMGKRVQKLLDFADASGDYDTFRRHLIDMAADAAPQELATRLARGGMMARLMGIWRGRK